MVPVPPAFSVKEERKLSAGKPWEVAGGKLENRQEGFNSLRETMTRSRRVSWQHQVELEARGSPAAAGTAGEVPSGPHDAQAAPLVQSQGDPRTTQQKDNKAGPEGRWQGR